MRLCAERCDDNDFWPPPDDFLGRRLSVIGLEGFGPALAFVFLGPGNLAKSVLFQCSFSSQLERIGILQLML